jgi:hypothetical protein
VLQKGLAFVVGASVQEHFKIAPKYCFTLTEDLGGQYCEKMEVALLAT